MAARPFWWGDFTTEDFNSIDPAATIAVLPVAAIEQHGPHLPVSTDLSIMAGMLATVAGRMPDDVDMRVLPIQPVGKSNEHLYAPGTLTVDAPTLIAHWSQLGDSVARAGIGKMVIVNSHGGNEEIIGIVAREMRVRAGMMVVKSSWSRFGVPEGLYAPGEMAHGIHGGDMETSLMLHFRPELVRMERASDFRSIAAEAEVEFDLLRPTGPFGYAWIASDLNPAGTVGNAARATAARGRATAEHQAAGFVKLLGEVRRADLGRYVPGRRARSIS